MLFVSLFLLSFISTTKWRCKFVVLVYTIYLDYATLSRRLWINNNDFWQMDDRYRLGGVWVRTQSFISKGWGNKNKKNMIFVRGDSNGTSHLSLSQKISRFSRTFNFFFILTKSNEITLRFPYRIAFFSTLLSTNEHTYHSHIFNLPAQKALHWIGRISLEQLLLLLPLSTERC